jgi:hypothetical protein
MWSVLAWLCRARCLRGCLCPAHVDALALLGSGPGWTSLARLCQAGACLANWADLVLTGPAPA